MLLASDDARIYYEANGEGPALVLLHPFPTNHEFWQPITEQLATRYRLIIPDLRGHGASEAGNGPATMEKHAADIARICDHAEIERAVFAGVSIGGYILFEFWRRYRERVRALILCDTRAQADTSEARATRLKSADEIEKSGSHAYIESMMPKWIGESTRRHNPERVATARKILERTSAAGMVAALRGMAARPDSIPTLKSIQAPALVMVGSEDTLTPRADAELMHKEIPGSKFAIIPAAGHYGPFEQPVAAVKEMRAFLDDLSIG